MRKIKVTSQNQMADVFKEYGAPDDIVSNVGGYTPYGTESENDIFDEAMRCFTFGAKSVTLIYKHD